MMPVIDTDSDRIDTPNADWARMAVDWELIHDLLGGTKAMRRRGNKWLPKEPAERGESYMTRLGRSHLYPALRNSIGRITSRPFGKPVSVKGELPERLGILEHDIDGMGKSLTDFARDVFKAGATYGKTHILVDYARMTGDESRAEQQSRGRPIFIHIRPPQLIGWDTSIGIGGEKQLDRIRWRDTRIERVGEYGSTRVHYMYLWERDPQQWFGYRYIEPQTSSHHESSDFFQTDGIFEQVPFEPISELAGPYRFLLNGQKRIPLITIYFNRTDWMVAEPPLCDLADMNLIHWQSFSDQRNILRFARVPQMQASGFTRRELKGIRSLSVNNIWQAKDPNATVRVIEHTGKAIDAGEKDIQRIEDRMELLGMAPLLERTQDATATGIVANESRATSDVLAWIESEESGLKQAFEYAAIHESAQLPEDFGIDIFSRFAVPYNDVTFGAIERSRERGDIDQRTFLEHGKFFGVFREEMDVEEVVSRSSAELPPLPPMQEPDNGGGDMNA